MKDIYHIIPEDDLRPHISNMKCPCNPQENEDGNIVHNSYDGREYNEVTNYPIQNKGVI